MIWIKKGSNTSSPQKNGDLPWTTNSKTKDTHIHTPSEKPSASICTNTGYKRALRWQWKHSGFRPQYLNNPNNESLQGSLSLCLQKYLKQSHIITNLGTHKKSTYTLHAGGYQHNGYGGR